LLAEDLEICVICSNTYTGIPSIIPFTLYSDFQKEPEYNKLVQTTLEHIALDKLVGVEFRLK